MTPFSVCISVYKNDHPLFFQEALNSVMEQTLPPAEIVLIVDGPIDSGIERVITQAKEKCPVLKVIYLEKNQGLGNALKIAVENATYDIIARMDSDDIALPSRFEKQMACFESDPQLSISGGAIAEFIDLPDNIVGIRECPLEDSSIKKYMKSRCGFNHVTVMFKKSEVLKAGSYKDWFWNEDYYLWIRMMQAGCKFSNLPDILVNVRVGKDMYARRGGRRYFNSEVALQKYMLNHHIISIPRFLYNILMRLVVQILLPRRLRGEVFQKLFRKNI